MSPIPCIPAELNDADLLSSLKALAREGSKIERQIIDHLTVVDDRRLYLKMGEPSLFEFARKWLNASESTTARRLRVMRTARLYPAVAVELEAGGINLTALAMLGPVLTVENHAQLLRDCRGLSTREVERRVAALQPQPPAKDVIRRVGTKGLTLVEGEPGPKVTAGLQFNGSSEAPMGPGPAVAAGMDLAGSKPGLNPAGDTEPVRRVATEAEVQSGGARKPASVKFKTATRARISFDAEDTLLTKIERLRELQIHKENAKGMAALLEAACDALLDKVDPLRKISRKKARIAKKAAKHNTFRQEKSSATAVDVRATEVTTTDVSTTYVSTTEVNSNGAGAPTSSASAPAPAPAAPPPPTATPHRPAKASRYIPAAVRDLTWEESGGQCMYVSPNGTRCSARGALEYDHCRPFALGGQSDPGNVRHYCRGHNSWAAEQTFGVAAIKGAIKAARARAHPDG